MGAYDHDPFVDLLQRRERGAEDVFFHRRDRDLIARMRARRRESDELRARELAHMRCPECGLPLVEVVRRGVATEQCPSGHGLWVPPDALETIPAREHDAWFDRYVHMRW
jgi:TFIIB-like protein